MTNVTNSHFLEYRNCTRRSCERSKVRCRYENELDGVFDFRVWYAIFCVAKITRWLFSWPKNGQVGYFEWAKFGLKSGKNACHILSHFENVTDFRISMAKTRFSACSWGGERFDPLFRFVTPLSHLSQKSSRKTPKFDFSLEKIGVTVWQMWQKPFEIGYILAPVGTKLGTLSGRKTGVKVTKKCPKYGFGRVYKKPFAMKNARFWMIFRKRVTNVWQKNPLFKPKTGRQGILSHFEKWKVWQGFWLIHAVNFNLSHLSHFLYRLILENLFILFLSFMENHYV